MRKKVAFQGEAGAFSEEAARNLLGVEFEPEGFRTFDEVFDAVAGGHAMCAVVPIENSLAGSVLRNYELMADADLTIRGETFVRIKLNLLGPPGSTLASVRRAHSHPVALAQCARFLTKQRIEAVAGYDTAGSVKMVVERGSHDDAAIAGDAAAEAYGATILAEGVEDHPANYTRFLLLVPNGAQIGASDTGSWKTTLLFRTPNRPGALFRALAAFALRDIDLMKIESRPIEGRPWEYSFYTDVAGSAEEPLVARAIDQLREMCESVRVLGSYPASQLP